MSKAAKRERQRQNRDARREYEEQIAKRRRRMRSIRNFAFLLIPFLIIFAVIALTNSGGDSSSKNSATNVTCKKVSMPPAKQVTIAAPTQMTIDPSQQYTATIDTTCGPIEVSLAAADAPVSVNSFVHLADANFYNDLAFVRAVKTGVVQAGSASQDNAGAPPYTVQGEVPKSTPPYPIGTVAMAKTGTDPAGTVGSQFFIVTGNGFVNLPPDYALLGKVTKGLDVAKKIQSFAPSSGDGPPTTVVVMNKVTIASGSGATTTTTAPTSTTAAP